MGDIDYFRKRLAEELALGASSTDEGVRTVHERLAELYAERLAKLGADGGRVMPPAQQVRLANVA